MLTYLFDCDKKIIIIVVIYLYRASKTLCGLNSEQNVAVFTTHEGIHIKFECSQYRQKKSNKNITYKFIAALSTLFVNNINF